MNTQKDVESIVKVVKERNKLLEACKYVAMNLESGQQMPQIMDKMRLILAHVIDYAEGK